MQNVIHARIHEFVSLSHAGNEGSIEGIPVGPGPPARFAFSASPISEALYVGASDAPLERVRPPARAGSLVSVILAEAPCGPAKTPSRASQSCAYSRTRILSGNCGFNVREKRDFSIILNLNRERRYSGDVAQPTTGNSFTSRMAPSISLRLHTISEDREPGADRAPDNVRAALPWCRRPWSRAG